MNQREKRFKMLLLPSRFGNWQKGWWEKLKATLFLVIGYLLSPLSWWNDLFFNMPIAYGFGYICSFFSPDLLLPACIVGYWFSNIAGILLMQFGALSLFQQSSQKRNFKKELLTGLVSSTAYTLLIFTLVQLNVLETPLLFAREYLINFHSFFTGLLS